MNHIGTQFSYSTPYQAHLKKQTFGWVKKKEENGVISQEIAFKKSQKLFVSWLRSLARTKASAAG